MVHFAHQLVSTLSGGQQQRGGDCPRADAAGEGDSGHDEPIASLDSGISAHRDGHPARHQQNDGITVVVTPHQVDYALRYCERIVALRQARLLRRQQPQFDNERFDHLYPQALTASKRTRKLP